MGRPVVGKHELLKWASGISGTLCSRLEDLTDGTILLRIFAHVWPKGNGGGTGYSGNRLLLKAHQHWDVRGNWEVLRLAFAELRLPTQVFDPAGVQAGRFRPCFNILVLCYFLAHLGRNRNFSVDFAYPIDQHLAAFLQSHESLECLERGGGLQKPNADASAEDKGLEIGRLVYGSDSGDDKAIGGDAGVEGTADKTIGDGEIEEGGANAAAGQSTYQQPVQVAWRCERLEAQGEHLLANMRFEIDSLRRQLEASKQERQFLVTRYEQEIQEAATFQANELQAQADAFRGELTVERLRMAAERAKDQQRFVAELRKVIDGLVAEGEHMAQLQDRGESGEKGADLIEEELRLRQLVIAQDRALIAAEERVQAVELISKALQEELTRRNEDMQQLHKQYAMLCDATLDGAKQLGLCQAMEEPAAPAGTQAFEGELALTGREMALLQRLRKLTRDNKQEAMAHQRVEDELRGHIWRQQVELRLGKAGNADHAEGTYGNLLLEVQEEHASRRLRQENARLRRDNAFLRAKSFVVDKHNHQAKRVSVAEATQLESRPRNGSKATICAGSDTGPSNKVAPSPRSVNDSGAGDVPGHSSLSPVEISDGTRTASQGDDEAQHHDRCYWLPEEDLSELGAEADDSVPAEILEIFESLIAATGVRSPGKGSGSPEMVADSKTGGGHITCSTTPRMLPEKKAEGLNSLAEHIAGDHEGIDSEVRIRASSARGSLGALGEPTLEHLGDLASRGRDLLWRAVVAQAVLKQRIRRSREELQWAYTEVREKSERHARERSQLQEELERAVREHKQEVEELTAASRAEFAALNVRSGLVEGEAEELQRESIELAQELRQARAGSLAEHVERFQTLRRKLKESRNQNQKLKLRETHWTELVECLRQVANISEHVANATTALADITSNPGLASVAEDIRRLLTTKEELEEEASVRVDSIKAVSKLLVDAEVATKENAGPDEVDGTLEEAMRPLKEQLDRSTEAVDKLQEHISELNASLRDTSENLARRTVEAEAEHVARVQMARELGRLTAANTELQMRLLHRREIVEDEVMRLQAQLVEAMVKFDEQNVILDAGAWMGFHPRDASVCHPSTLARPNMVSRHRNTGSSTSATGLREEERKEWARQREPARERMQKAHGEVQEDRTARAAAAAIHEADRLLGEKGFQNLPSFRQRQIYSRFVQGHALEGEEWEEDPETEEAIKQLESLSWGIDRASLTPIAESEGTGTEPEPSPAAGNVADETREGSASDTGDARRGMQARTSLLGSRGNERDGTRGSTWNGTCGSTEDDACGSIGYDTCGSTADDMCKADPSQAAAANGMDDPALPEDDDPAGAPPPGDSDSPRQGRVTQCSDDNEDGGSFDKSTPSRSFADSPPRSPTASDLPGFSWRTSITETVSEDMDRPEGWEKLDVKEVASEDVKEADSEILGSSLETAVRGSSLETVVRGSSLETGVKGSSIETGVKGSSMEPHVRKSAVEDHLDLSNANVGESECRKMLPVDDLAHISEVMVGHDAAPVEQETSSKGRTQSAEASERSVSPASTPSSTSVDEFGSEDLASLLFPTPDKRDCPSYAVSLISVFGASPASSSAPSLTRNLDHSSSSAALELHPDGSQRVGAMNSPLSRRVDDGAHVIEAQSAHAQAPKSKSERPQSVRAQTPETQLLPPFKSVELEDVDTGEPNGGQYSIDHPTVANDGPSQKASPSCTHRPKPFGDQDPFNPSRSEGNSIEGAHGTVLSECGPSSRRAEHVSGIAQAEHAHRNRPIGEDLGAQPVSGQATHLCSARGSSLLSTLVTPTPLSDKSPGQYPLEVKDGPASWLVSGTVSTAHSSGSAALDFASPPGTPGGSGVYSPFLLSPTRSSSLPTPPCVPLSPTMVNPQRVQTQAAPPFWYTSRAGAPEQPSGGSRPAGGRGADLGEASFVSVGSSKSASDLGDLPSMGEASIDSINLDESPVMDLFLQAIRKERQRPSMPNLSKY